MTKLSFLLLFVMTLFSCEPAKLRRDLSVETQEKDSASQSLSTKNGAFTAAGSSRFDHGSGFAHCSSVPTASATEIGQARVCQNTADPYLLRVQIDRSHGSERTCLITTLTDSSGKLLPLIYHASCFSHQAEEIKAALLKSNVFGFSQVSPNSVILVKESRAAGFYQCIHASQNFINNPANCCSIPLGANCNGQSFSQQQCQNAAANYRANICQQYKNANKDKYYVKLPLN